MTTRGGGNRNERRKQEGEEEWEAKKEWEMPDNERLKENPPKNTGSAEQGRREERRKKGEVEGDEITVWLTGKIRSCRERSGCRTTLANENITVGVHVSLTTLVALQVLCFLQAALGKGGNGAWRDCTCGHLFDREDSRR